MLQAERTESSCGCGISSSASGDLDLSLFSPNGSVGENQNFRFQQIMLRIKDPKITISFYEKNFRMICVHEYHFYSMKFSIYFLCEARNDVELPKRNTKESEKYIWNTNSTLLELTHNHEMQSDNIEATSDFKKNCTEFGLISFITNNFSEQCRILEMNRVLFCKPFEGNSTEESALVFDPNGFTIEIKKRSDSEKFKEMFNLLQCMLRVKNIEKSLHFYMNILGLHLIRVSHHDNYSLYFLVCLSKSETHPNAFSSKSENYSNSLCNTLLVLNYKHEEAQKSNYSCTAENEKIPGFGHIGFLCDDLHKTCSLLDKKHKVLFKKKPEEGKMRGIAFIYDPDKYLIEIIQKDISFC